MTNKNYIAVFSLKIIFIVIFCAIYFCLVGKKSYAYVYGFVMPKGTGFLRNEVGVEQFNGFDTTGQYTDETRVMRTRYSLYGEYGLFERLTIGAHIVSFDNMINASNSWFAKADQRSFGLNSCSVFSRFAIIKSKTFHLSVVTLLQSPSHYKKNAASYFDLPYMQYETRIEAGFLPTDNLFLMFSLAYHGNINNWYDELRFNCTLGYFVIPEVLLLVRFQKYSYVIKKSVLKKLYPEADVSFFDVFSGIGFAQINFAIATPLTKQLSFEFGFFESIQSAFTRTKELNLKSKGFYFSLWLWI